MGRQPCCDKLGVKKGPWTAEEDRKLISFIMKNGHCCWRAVPKLAGLLRCGKSCRLRWTNYLRPDLKRGLLSEAEEQVVIDLHERIGNRWSKIAAKLPGRTDNEIKNHWNTHIKKKLLKMGIDPVTHKPLDPEASSNTSLSAAMNESKSEYQSLPQEDNQCQINNSLENTSPTEASTINADGVESSVHFVLEGDITPLDGEWQFPSAEENSSDLGSITWEQNYEWLLDYQDFGIGDLGTESSIFDGWN